MNRTEANSQAKKIFDEWLKAKEEIEKQAKENGTWEVFGLDSNNHLFKDIDKEAKEKLKALKAMVNE